MRATKRCAALAACLCALGCSRGSLKLGALGQAARYNAEPRLAPAVQTPPGFHAVIVAEGLEYPTSIAWDSAGTPYVLESHTVPIPLAKPRIMRITGGSVEPIEWSGPDAPSGEQAVGLVFHDGWLYFSHEEKDGSWGISRAKPEGGVVEAVVRGIPSRGDHWINYLAFRPDGTLVFGVGTATNSGVVSSHDPVDLKWIHKRPDAHDVACRDLVLTGRTFTEESGLAGQAGRTLTTGVYQPYGTSGAKTIHGSFPCTGALMALQPGAAEPRLLAWGFRNPVGVAIDDHGDVLVGAQGADLRGTRPVRDDPDAIYRLRRGAWYGWPDYAADLRPITDPRRRPPAELLPRGHTRLEFVVDHARSRLRPPDRSLLIATTEPHAAICGMTIVPKRGPFAAWAGKLLVSEMGDFKPATDPVEPYKHAGFQVEAVDLRTGERSVFARNRGSAAALPASKTKVVDGFERPVDIRIGPDGLVYVVDFGVFEATMKGGKVMPKTGKIFRIEPDIGTSQSAAAAPTPTP